MILGRPPNTGPRGTASGGTSLRARRRDRARVRSLVVALALLLLALALAATTLLRGGGGKRERAEGRAAVGATTTTTTTTATSAAATAERIRADEGPSVIGTGASQPNQSSPRTASGVDELRSRVDARTAALEDEVKTLADAVDAAAARVDAVLLRSSPPPPKSPPRNGEAKMTKQDARAEATAREEEAKIFSAPAPTDAAVSAARRDSERLAPAKEWSFPLPRRNDRGVVVTGDGGAAAKRGDVPYGGWARDIVADVARRDAVRDATRDAYAHYEKYAFGDDELRPRAKLGKNAFGGLGATIVDSLDTLWIMGLSDEYGRAREWVSRRLSFDIDRDASVFETTIRVLGGVLAAYDLSGDEMYINKATNLATRLKPAFATASGIPYPIVNLKTGRAKHPGWAHGSSPLAEFGTLSLEFVSLSDRVGDPRWSDLAETPIAKVQSVRGDVGTVPRGLYPMSIDPGKLKWSSGAVSFGAMGDSFFEYLLKTYVMGGRTRELRGWSDMWDESMRAMLEHLVFPGEEEGTKYVAEWNGRAHHKMDHLACFVGGMLVLGAHGSDMEKEYVAAAAEITKMCYRMYTSQPTMLAPEVVSFAKYEKENGGTPRGRRMVNQVNHNLQRPETIESIFYMYRKTGDPMYREWAWNMFCAMRKHYKTDSGWAGIKDVRRDPPTNDDTMQSFFIAETMKYMYLIFADGDVIDLDEWVFNTEAHPLKVKPRRETLVPPYKYS